MILSRFNLARPVAVWHLNIIFDQAEIETKEDDVSTMSKDHQLVSASVHCSSSSIDACVDDDDDDNISGPVKCSNIKIYDTPFTHDFFSVSGSFTPRAGSK